MACGKAAVPGPGEVSHHHQAIRPGQNIIRMVGRWCVVVCGGWFDVAMQILVSDILFRFLFRGRKFSFLLKISVKHKVVRLG